MNDPYLLKKFGLIEKSAEVPAPKPARQPTAPTEDVPKKKGKAPKKVLRKKKEYDPFAQKTSKGPREYRWLKDVDAPADDTHFSNDSNRGSESTFFFSFLHIMYLSLGFLANLFSIFFSRYGQVSSWLWQEDWGKQLCRGG